MKAAYDCGVNFFDCAEAYSKGESETVMGEAIKKYGWKRNDLVISTKVPSSFLLPSHTFRLTCSPKNTQQWPSTSTSKLGADTRHC
jgi:aryl-alcohol dehydrogenase-like predicted oxidoreductase